MIKLIAFDIDGTSINKYRYVLSSTLKALKRLKQEGYLIVPTTGRSLDGIPKAIKALDVCDFVISSNGARITNMKTGEDIETQCLDTAKTIEVLKVVEPFRVWLSLHIDGHCYDSTWLQCTARRIIFHGDFVANKAVSNLQAFVEKHHYKVEKIQVFSASRRKLLKMAQAIRDIEGIASPMSAKNYYEITLASANKGTGLQRLCEHLNQSMDSVFAIGDDANDIPMLRLAGVSVAMADSAPDVKAAATYVTGSASKDGFAQAIDRYVLHPTESIV